MNIYFVNQPGYNEKNVFTPEPFVKTEFDCVS